MTREVFVVLAMLVAVLSVPPALSSRGLSRWEVELFKGPEPNCTECLNKEYCCEPEVCCQGGSFCCERNMTCCGGTCCVGGESCCGPQYGESGVCCIIQTSYCCPPINNGATKSRCCPRWTICCDFEDDGCCDPADFEVYQQKTKLRSTRISNSSASTASALFVKGLDGLLTGEQINYQTGEQTVETKIPSTSFDTFGEATQLFMFDQARSVYYLLRADYSVPEPLPITLSTVDPITGKCSKRPVSGGATGQVTGYYYVAALDIIVFATPTPNASTGSYSFYKLSPAAATASAQAVLVSQFANTGNADLWTGYITAVSDDGSQVYRVGYQNAEKGINPGLGTTDIATPVASTAWTAVPLPDRYQFYQTATLYSPSLSSSSSSSSSSSNNNNKEKNTVDNGGSGPTFLSLSAQDALGQNLGLVQWNLTAASVLAQWDNAHSIPLFGSVAQCLSPDQQTFLALVAYGERNPVKDPWQAISVDLATNTAHSVELSPTLDAGANPISGLGIALS